MIQILSNRVKGSGKATEMKFPTVNLFLKKLPEGITIGLWAGVTKFGESISLISSYKDGFRIETNILNNTRVEVKEDEHFKINMISKLRDFDRITDINKTIFKDKELGNKFFSSKKSCQNCQLFYSRDYGYSNYTVEGTSYGCYAGKFEEVDTNYDFNYIQYNAINCNSMIDGECWELDVDGESQGPTEEWLKSIQRDVKINNLLDE